MVTGNNRGTRSCPEHPPPISTNSESLHWISSGFSQFNGFLVKHLWIHDGFLDSRYVLGFTLGSWIHDEFLNSRWVFGLTKSSLVQHGFWDSLCSLGFTMGYGPMGFTMGSLLGRPCEIVGRCNTSFNLMNTSLEPSRRIEIFAGLEIQIFVLWGLLFILEANMMGCKCNAHSGWVRRMMGQGGN